MADHEDDPMTYPRLGRILHWVDKPGSVQKLIWILVAACVVFVALDFTYEKHGYSEMERVFGFYAGFGFVAFACVIFGAKALRKLIMRPEDFYGADAIDTEDYPDEGLGKVNHDG